MEQYLTLFGQKKEDFTRFWVSVSTEVLKDGKGTGKYANANLQARLSDDIKELYEEHSEKTKTKGIRMLRIKASEFYIMAARSKDRDVEDYIYIYIKKAKLAESKKKKDDDDDEQEDD